MKYTLHNAPIETVFNLGLVANIFGQATFTDNFEEGLIESWSPYTSATVSLTENLGVKARQNYLLGSEPTPTESFRIAVPLKQIFGLANDYGKIIYGSNHSLILTRSSTDDNALCHGSTFATGKVKMNNIRWRLPTVTLKDMAKLELMRA